MKNLLATFAMLLFFSACASSGDGPSRSDDDPLGDGSGSVSVTGRRLLAFNLTVNPNGVIDTSGRGYYVILLNATGQQIEATDFDTFTDFLRFDGRNFDFFHRQANQPNVGFNFVQAGSLNSASRITPDGRSIEIVLDVGESTNFVNQFIVGTTFTAHALTSDNFEGAFIGRLLDTLGQGPNIDNNSLQTIRVRKGEGATSPLPQLYPTDPINDFITFGDLPGDFPYVNFDIARLEITAR